jgi:hypothetical protein
MDDERVIEFDIELERLEEAVMEEARLWLPALGVKREGMMVVDDVLLVDMVDCGEVGKGYIQETMVWQWLMEYCHLELLRIYREGKDMMLCESRCRFAMIYL